MKRNFMRPFAFACATGVLGLGVVALRPAPRVALHVVQMTSRGAGPRFEPAEISLHAGDTIRFINRRGGPHNVQFFIDSVAAGARSLLDSAIGETRIGPLAARLLWDAEESYALVVPGLEPGRYPFVCAPHYTAGMIGALIVTP
jgi:plastocyanin